MKKEVVRLILVIMMAPILITETCIQNDNFDNNSKINEENNYEISLFGWEHLGD